MKKIPFSLVLDEVVKVTSFIISYPLNTHLFHSVGGKIGLGGDMHEALGHTKVTVVVLKINIRAV